MSPEILANHLYGSNATPLLLRSKSSSILHKELHQNLLDKEMYLCSPALLYIRQGQQVISNFEGANCTINQGQLLFLLQDLYVERAQQPFSLRAHRRLLLRPLIFPLERQTNPVCLMPTIASGPKTTSSDSRKTPIKQ